ncbi:HPP family protein [Sphingopyxis sp.]|uniref:HPP family protein n=1 Tax=Sphingopyxis sp. TaxID=1908224 RepID=UPI002D7878CB|nr:HPP family protein [Sphingopyxis sp.]HET6525766.1 HPP family protein [Sphingopyxis sp.]
MFRALSTTTILLFVPLLAGASLRDRAIGSVGALIGIAVVGVFCILFFPAATPWIVAPVGASAVLLFAVPASPLAQPWSIVGGNVLSAAFGVIVMGMVPEPAVAAALAVGGAILIMSLLRCLHPPGGAAALSAVIGGHTLQSGHAAHLLLPMLVNSLLLVAAGWAFHRFSGHSYPHRAAPVEGKPVVAAASAGVLMDDIDAALADLGETFDIGREDLALLLARAEVHAASRIGRAQIAAVKKVRGKKAVREVEHS